MAGENRVHVFARSRPVGGDVASCPTVADEGSRTVRIYSEAELAQRRERQLASRGSSCCDGGASDNDAAGDSRGFSFDAVFDGDASQGDVFNEVGMPVLRECLKGFNGTILAYGQTGSGKTHSLLNQGQDSDDAGLLPRLVACLFVSAAQDVANVYEIEAAALQIYNEQVDDLLHPDHVSGGGNGLQVQNGGAVPGLTWVKCDQPEVLLSSFIHARTNIVYAETKMNKASSRSHAVFQVKITKRRRVTEEEGQEGGAVKRMECTIARLNVVDLAGSERIKKSGVEGMQLKEATAINRSLLAFGNVVSALAAKRSHVPFRESKLTRILDGSIGGNTKTSLLVCISPAAINLNETLSTLEFASRAMSVEVDAKVNVGVVEVDAKALPGDLQSSFDNLLIQSHRAELDELRRCTSEDLERAQMEVKRLEAVAAEAADAAGQTTAEELAKMQASQAQETERLRAEAEKAHQESSALQAELQSSRTKAEGEVAAERARGDQNAEEAQRLVWEVANMRDTFAQEKAEFQRALDSAASEAATQRARAGDLERQHGVESEKTRQLEVEVKASREAISKQQAELEGLSAAADARSLATKAMEDEMETLRTSQEELQSLHAAAAADAAAEKARGDELQRFHASAEEDAAVEKARGDEFEKLHTDQAEEARGLKAELASAHDTISQQQEDLARLRLATEDAGAAEKARKEELERLRAALMEEKHAKSNLQAELEKMCAAAEGDAAAARTRFEELEKSHTKQTGKMQKVEEDFAAALETISQQQSELETLRSKAEGATASQIASEEESQKLCAAHSHEIERLEAEALIEIERLEAEAQMARDNITELQEELSRATSAAEEDAAATKSRSDAIKKRQAAHAEQAQKLQADVARAHEIIAMKEGQLEKMREAAAAADKANEDQLQQLRVSHAKKVQRLEADAGKAHQAVSQLQSELEAAETAAESQVSVESNRVDELEKLHVMQANEAQRLEAELAKAHDAISGQKSELERLQVAKESAHAAERALAEELDNLLTSHAEEKQRLEAEVAKSRKTTSQTRAELEKIKAAAATSKVEEAQRLEAQKLEAQRLEAEAEVAMARDTISKQQTELQKLEAALELARDSQHQAQPAEADAQAEEVKRLEAEVASCRTTISQQQTELERLEEVVEDAEFKTLQIMEARALDAESQARSAVLQVISLEDAAVNRNAELEHTRRERDAAIAQVQEVEGTAKKSAQEEGACAVKLVDTCRERDAAEAEALKATERAQEAEARAQTLEKEMLELKKASEPQDAEDTLDLLPSLPQNWIRLGSKGATTYMNIDTGAVSMDIPTADLPQFGKKAEKRAKSQPPYKDAGRCAHDEELRTAKVEAEDWQEHALQCCKRMQSLEDELRVLKELEGPEAAIPDNKVRRHSAHDLLSKSSTTRPIRVKSNVPIYSNKVPSMTSRPAPTGSSKLRPRGYLAGA